VSNQGLKFYDMTVSELTNELKKYDPEREVLVMRERGDEDITYADSIDEVQQRTLARDYFEYTEFPAVVLLHKILKEASAK
jgi:hypothetical protein